MKKKILIMITSLKIGGGAQRMASLLSLQLSQKYDIYILTFYHFKKRYKFGGNYYSLYENANRLKTCLRPFKVFKYIQKTSPDLIISFMDHVNLFVSLLKLIFHIRIPLIFSVQNNPQLFYKEQMRYMNIFIKLFYRTKLVQKITVVAKDIQNILIDSYNIKKDKLQVIYNAIIVKDIINLKKDEVYDYSEIFNNSNIIKYINMARLEEVKGQYYLIKAFSLVKNKLPHSKLFIMGDGTLKKKLKSYTKEIELKNDIIFLGLRKNPYKYLSKCDIFVLSSKHEGLPLSLLEALACGLPIISTRCKTGPEEILDNGKYGLLVNVKDPEDLAEKMINLARDPELLNKFSKISLERAKFFDLETIKEKWINLIESYIN